MAVPVYSSTRVYSHIAEAGLRDDWKQYLSKEDGRKRFQLDLGVLLMEFGIRYDWGDIGNEKKRPNWMRQKPLRPCECNFCFFCKEGMTDGIYHARGTKRKASIRNRTRKRAKVCSGIRESFYTSAHCGPCYRAQDASLSTSMRRQIAGVKRDGKGGYPLKGCLNCNERVCQGCWLTYDHFPTQEKDRLGK